MSPKRSSVAVVLVFATFGTLALLPMAMREYLPLTWAALGFLAFFVFIVLAMAISLHVLGKRRRAQAEQWRAEINRHERELLRACGICSMGICLSSFEGTFLRLIGSSFLFAGLSLALWHLFRAWPERPGANGNDQSSATRPAA